MLYKKSIKERLFVTQSVLSIFLIFILLIFCINLAYSAEDSASVDVGSVNAETENVIVEQSVENEESTLNNSEEEADFVYVDIEDVAALNITTSEETVNISNLAQENITTQENLSQETNLTDENYTDIGINEDYSYIPIENFTVHNQEEENNSDISEKIYYVFYKGSEKEIEVLADKGLNLKISKDEQISEGTLWKKEVKIYSDSHVEDELIAYSDVLESEGDVSVYWKEENKYLDFESYDMDENGVTDKISWKIPHLSEQNFEIIIGANGTNTEADYISISNVLIPNSTITQLINNKIGFSFNISYYDLANVSCEFSIKNSSNVSAIYQNVSFGNYSSTLANLDNGAYNWKLYCFDNTNVSISNTSAGAFNVNIDYTPRVSFYFSNNSIIVNGSSVIWTNISLVKNMSFIYLVNFGDGNISNSGNMVNLNSINSSINHVYSKNGSFSPALTLILDNGNIYNYTASISVNNSVISTDKTPPVLKLKEPEDNSVIHDDNLTFIYHVSDNVNVANCTFNIYFYNNSIVGTSVYSNLNNSIKNDSDAYYSLKDFSEGDYSWDVVCFDNSSNYNEKSNEFSISLPDEESENNSVQTIRNNTSVVLSSEDSSSMSEIDDLVLKINDFLINEESFDIAESEASDSLDLATIAKTYKKQLLQMKLDIEHNLDYVREQDRRDARREEINTQIAEIKKNLVVNLEVKDKKEYFKNTFFDKDYLKSVAQSYLTLKKISLNGADFDNFIETLLDMQKAVSVFTTVKHVKIDHVSGSDEITLITKKVESKNETLEIIVEVLPDALLGKTIILNSNLSAGENLYEVKFSDLREGNLVYYADGFINFDEIEKTNTLSFKEPASSKGSVGSISGLVTFLGGDLRGGSLLYFVWFFIILAAVFVTVFGHKMVNVVRVARIPAAAAIIEKIRQSERFLRGGELFKAKEIYGEIRSLYSQVPVESKKLVYGKIEQLKRSISRKDAISLVKELILASREERKEDFVLVYNNIKKIYEDLSESDRKKLYNKVKPYLKKQGFI